MDFLHKAIYTVHTNAVRVDKDKGIQEEIVAYDRDGNEVSIDWATVNSKNTELTAAEEAAEAQKATNKTNAKVKLIAGEALTEAEADAITG